MRLSWSIRCAAAILAALLGFGGLLSAQSGDPALLLETAIQKQMSGDIAGAVTQFTAILEKLGDQHPLAGPVLWRLGQAQELLGRVEDARRSYQRVVRQHGSETKLKTAAETRLAVLAENEGPVDEDHGLFVVDDTDLDDPRRQGQLVVFSDLSVYDARKKEKTPLTKVARSAAYPVPSPQPQAANAAQRQVAYVSWNGDLSETFARQAPGYAGGRTSAELRVVNIDGAGDRLLVRGGFRWLRPYGWTEDGRTILALFERTNGQREIALVAASDGSVRVLKSRPALAAKNMSISSDGQFFAYEAPTAPSLQQYDIFLMPVTPGPASVSERRYSFSQRTQRAAPVTADDIAIHVLNRLGYGPRRGDIERVKAMGIDAYIEQQLNPERIPDPVVDAMLAGFPSFKMEIPELLEKGGPVVAIAGRRRATLFERPEIVERERAQAKSRTSTTTAAASGEPELIRAADAPAGFELGAARLLRAVHSQRQLQEVMVDFWMNHFNAKLGDHQLASHFEEMTIRGHAFGRFEDLLFAVAKHPRMLYYLDNWKSSAPADVVNQRLENLSRTADADAKVTLLERTPFLKDSKGLNENFARELLELHTLGVDGGYKQEDVINVAKILTGWTIGSRGLINAREDDGVFLFDPLMHVDGDKVVLGKTIKSGGVDEGEQLLRMLAQHPSTARFISTKLARRFISDDPPAAVIDAASRTFQKTGGDIREVVRTIITSPQFRSGDAVRSKIKKPLELVASSLRAVDATFEDLEAYDALLAGNRSPIARMGEKVYEHEAPDGNPDVGAAWMNSNALLLRLEFANNLATGRVAGVKINLQAAQALLGQLGIPKPTPTQIEQTRAMLQSASAAAAPATAGQPKMATTMAGASGGATVNASNETDSLVVAAMLGSPQFQKR